LIPVAGFSYTSPRLNMTPLLRLVEPHGGRVNWWLEWAKS
jgi:hypothetical protein